MNENSENKIIYREKINYLIDWSKREEFEPLMVLGSRQVGKTFLLVELFAKKYFNNKFVYINFMTDTKIKEQLYGIKDAKEIIYIIQKYYEITIDNSWLIIFDEIQEIPSLRTSLKSFNEKFKNYYKVIVSGSYLGNVMMVDNEGFPVGQIEKIIINPVSFKEYLITTNDSDFVETIELSLLNNKKLEISENIHNLFIEKLKTFLLVSGMPRVLSMFLTNPLDVQKFSSKRKEIYDSYVTDLTKYIQSKTIDKSKAISLYINIQKSFAKQNNKFILNTIQKGARLSNYNDALNLLLLSNLVFKLTKLSEVRQKASIVSDYDYNQNFKLYFNDFGFINNFYKLNDRNFWDSDGEMGNVKGSLIENFVIAELSNKVDVNNWTRYYTFKVNSNSYEIDLLIEDIHHDLIPIEIKSSKQFNISSLKKYIDIYKPKYAIVFSLKNFNIGEYNNTTIYYLPLYAVGMLNIVDSRLVPLKD